MRFHSFLFLIVGVLFFLPHIGTHAEEAKPRIIATTDGEIDDRCSMVRFLLYANEWDIEGIIYSSSKFHWKGHHWAGEDWIERDIDLYARFYENLKKHDPDFPSPEALKKLVYVGNIDDVGAMKKDTPGSDRIVEILLDEEPGPVYLQAWGGTNTIARALWKIQQEHPDQMKKVSRKAIIYIILDQDPTFREYIEPNWPEIQVLGSFRQFAAVAYDWRKLIPERLHHYYESPWMTEHILQRHGPLCARYEAKDGAFRSEGDTPAFWHQIDVGLGSLEDPSYGGWGGRFIREKPDSNTWQGALDDGDIFKPLWRWSEAFQNDWAARADWCVKSYEEANHAPKAVALDHSGKSILHVNAEPGSTISLSAQGSSDPDGDPLAYHWWIYREAGTYWDVPEIEGSDKMEATLAVPENASGRAVHVILNVTDQGNPPLTSYRRVIVNVAGKPIAPPVGTPGFYLDTPLTELPGPPKEMGPSEFYRGINVHGSAVTLDENPWEGQDAENFVCDGNPLEVRNVRLRPPTNETREKMIRSFRWGRQLEAKLTQVPDGKYAVYAYFWEETSPTRFDISLNGKAVIRGYSSGHAGQWQRLGPWITSPKQGEIVLTAKGGDANLSGFEIWRLKRE